MGFRPSVTYWPGPLVLASVLIAPHVASAQSVGACHGERRVCETLVNGERELASMLVSGDIGIVARLFADDAIWSLGTGKRWTKPEAMVALPKMPRPSESRLSRADVHQFGTVAIVTWNERWRASPAGREEETFGTDTWMLRGGRWRIIASQEAHSG